MIIMMNSVKKDLELFCDSSKKVQHAKPSD